MSIATTERSSSAPCDRFRAWVAAARLLEAAEGGARARFLRFCNRVRPVVHARLVRSAKDVCDRLDAAFGGIPSVDPFAALGIWGDENRYSDFLAWLVRRDGAWPGHVFAYAAAQAVDPSFLARDPGVFLRAHRELVTTDGRIDVVLVFTKYITVFEVKTYTAEHMTPSGRSQTESYADVLRHQDTENGVPERPVFTVLLSPDGRAPVSPDARALSMARLALALADAIPEDMPTPTTAFIEQVLCHFVAVSVEAHGGALADVVAADASDGADSIFRCSRSIVAAERALLLEGADGQV